MTATKGGPGSGNFGHAGRPGEVGGSALDPDIVPVDAKESAFMSKDIKDLAMMVRYMRKELAESGKKARKETRAILRKPFQHILDEARKMPKGDKTRAEIENRVADTIGMAEYRVEALLQNEMERNLQTLLGDKYDAVMTRIANMVNFEGATDEEAQARNIERWWNLKPSSVGDQLDSFRMDERWDGAFVEEAVGKAVDMRKGMVIEIMAEASKSNIKGGPGSGNHGHAGRPGEVGNSGSGGPRGRSTVNIGTNGSSPHGDPTDITDFGDADYDFMQAFAEYAMGESSEGPIDQDDYTALSEFAGTRGQSVPNPARTYRRILSGLDYAQKQKAKSPATSVAFIDSDQNEIPWGQIELDSMITFFEGALTDLGQSARAGFLFEKKTGKGKSSKKPALRPSREEDVPEEEEEAFQPLTSSRSKEAVEKEPEGTEPTTPPPDMSMDEEEPVQRDMPADEPADDPYAEDMPDPEMGMPGADMRDTSDPDGFDQGMDLTGEENNGTAQALLESAMHESFTVAADTLYRHGIVDRDERLALSGVVGDVLRIASALMLGTLGEDFMLRPLQKPEPMRIQAPSVAPAPVRLAPNASKPANVQKPTQRPPIRAWAEIARPDVRAASDMYMAVKGVSGPTIEPRDLSFRELPDLMAIKALGRNRVGGYLCLWGDQNHRDVYKEFFTPGTEERMSVFKAVGALPALYHHAMDNVVKSLVVGLVDTMEDDDVGCWIEAQIKEHKAYRQMISPLMEQKVLGWSSGALPGGRRVNKSSGEILRWPVVEASITHTPAEWRMLAEWPAQNLKSVWTQSGLKGMDSFNRVVNRDALEQEKLALALLELEESL